MRIQNNMMAINSYRQAGINHLNQSKTTEKLSSGYSINRAADDAAGLSISEKMRAQIRGLNRGSANVQDGISAIQVMDAGMSKISDMMLRQRELMVQALNDTYSDEDKDAIQKELDQLTEEIGSVAEKTQFNTLPLLNVPMGNDEGVSEEIQNLRDLIKESYRLVLEPGGTNEQIRNLFTEFSAMSAASPLNDLQRVAGDLLSAVETGNASFVDIITKVDALIVKLGEDYFDADKLSNYRTQTQFHYFDTVHYDGIYYGPSRDGAIAAAAASTSADAYASLTGAFAAAWGGGGGLVACHEPVVSAAWALLEGVTAAGGEKFSGENALNIQAGANTLTSDVIKVTRYDCRPESLGIATLVTKPWEDAKQSLDDLDAAFGRVNQYRARAGAQQNRLEHTILNSDNISENMTSAESRIRDTDMAKEMMRFVKGNILNQASTGMLAQANQTPQTVLSLLR